MVALRRRNRASESNQYDAPQMGVAPTAVSAERSAVVAQGPRTPAVAVTPANAAPPPSVTEQPAAEQPPTDDLRERLRALEQAERERARLLAAERAEQTRQEILANMAQQRQQPVASSPATEARADALVKAHPHIIGDAQIQSAVQQMMRQGMPADAILDVLELHLAQQPERESVEQHDDEPIEMSEAPAPERPAPPVRKPATMLASEPHESDPERYEPTAEQTRRASMVSAPVSREAPSYRTGRPDSGRVRLSVAEQEIARASGLTDVQYAEQKIRMQQARAADPERFRDR